MHDREGFWKVHKNSNLVHIVILWWNFYDGISCFYECNKMR